MIELATAPGQPLSAERARALLLLQGPHPRRGGRCALRGAAVPPRDRVRPGLRAARARARAPRRRRWRSAPGRDAADRGGARRDGARRSARRRAAAARPRAHPARVGRSPGRDRGVPRHPQRRARRRERSRRARRDLRRRRSDSARSASCARCSIATSTTRPRIACSRRSTTALGDTERATRVLTALDLLGFAEETDRADDAAPARARRVAQPLRRALDDEHRERLLLDTRRRASRSARCSTAFAEELTALVAQPSLGENVHARAGRSSRASLQLAREVGAPVRDRCRDLHRRARARPRSRSPRSRASSSSSIASLLAEARPAHCASCSATRSRRSAAATRRCSSSVHASAASSASSCARLLSADVELTGAGGRPRATTRATTPRKVLERHAGTRDVDPGAWIDGMLACAKRAGLVACDDFAAAIWMVARLSGETLASHDDDRRARRGARRSRPRPLLSIATTISTCATL